MTSVRLDTSRVERLKKAAEEAGLTQSELIRSAIDEKVERILARPPQGRTFIGRLAGLEYLIGSVELEEPVSAERLGDTYAADLDERWEEHLNRRRAERQRRAEPD